MVELSTESRQVLESAVVEILRSVLNDQMFFTLQRDETTSRFVLEHFSEVVNQIISHKLLEQQRNVQEALEQRRLVLEQLHQSRGI